MTFLPNSPKDPEMRTISTIGAGLIAAAALAAPAGAARAAAARRPAPMVMGERIWGSFGELGRWITSPFKTMPPKRRHGPAGGP